MSTNNIRYILADEVGPGKTIEAGMIVKELAKPEKERDGIEAAYRNGANVYPEFRLMMLARLEA